MVARRRTGFALVCILDACEDVIQDALRPSVRRRAQLLRENTLQRMHRQDGLIAECIFAQRLPALEFALLVRTDTPQQDDLIDGEILMRLQSRIRCVTTWHSTGRCGTTGGTSRLAHSTGREMLGDIRQSDLLRIPSCRRASALRDPISAHDIEDTLDVGEPIEQSRHDERTGGLIVETRQTEDFCVGEIDEDVGRNERRLLTPRIRLILRMFDVDLRREVLTSSDTTQDEREESRERAGKRSV
jgi:hypothetical protein